MNQTGQTERNRGESHKHVYLSPASRRLTDRQYVIRKLISSTKPHASILKTPQPKMDTQENKCDVYRRESSDMSFLTRPTEELTHQCFHRDVSPPSVSNKPCGSSMTVSELRGSQSHEEHTFKLPLFSSRSSEQSLSGSIAEFEPLNRPLRQSLTSTVLNPTYTPQPADLKSGQKEGRGWGRWGLCSTGEPSERELTSPHKANYWACAIPKDLPQSPDRHSAGWDPNKEYEALLDYTYPLRTHHLTCECDSSEHQKHSFLQTDMQDSGIEVNICSWTSPSGLDFSVNSTRQTEERNHHTLDHGLTDLQGFSSCSPSDDLLFLTDPVSLYLKDLDSTKVKGELNSNSDDDHHLQCHKWPFSISTRILHQPMCSCVEEDEEFRSLPERLNELQLLSTQVRVIAAQLSQPVTGSWSMDPGTSSIFSSVTSPEKHEAKNKTRKEKSQDDMNKEEWNVTQSAAASHRDFVSLRSNGRCVEAAGGRSSVSGLKVEALLKQLCDLTLHKSSQEEQEQSHSLLQHIQVFCSHLEQLIQYLYEVSVKMELLAQPAVDITRLKLSLDEYQREVKNHLPLTSCVMHSGQILLSCINTMSPFLRDTLQLVAKESEALQSYNQHFSSILSDMDNLVQQSKEEETLGI